jgi:hypothetical protein
MRNPWRSGRRLDAVFWAPVTAVIRRSQPPGTLAKAEPKTLRCRIVHAAARLTRGSRQRRLNIQVAPPASLPIFNGTSRISWYASAAFSRH